jgi:phosphate acetyltransferase
MPITPRLFQFQIKARARARRQRIVLPEGNDPRVVTAACELLSRGLCKVILLGDVDDVSKLAQRLQINIQDATVIDNQTYEGLEVSASVRNAVDATLQCHRTAVKHTRLSGPNSASFLL